MSPPTCVTRSFTTLARYGLCGLALARKTEWIDTDGGWSLPVGQRVLVTDEAETALVDIRTLSIAQAEGAEPEAA